MDDTLLVRVKKIAAACRQNTSYNLFSVLGIETKEVLICRVLADLQRRQGSFSPPQTEGGFAALMGRGPAACVWDYAAELPAFTGGRGSFTAVFGGYEPCHNAEEVIAAAGYDFERDTENPAGSVFCSHGAGYPVSWDEVPSHAHCAL